MPDSAVATARPTVSAGLAAQTRRMTRGRPATVPLADCLISRSRLRRSVGLSGGGSGISGEPVSPLCLVVRAPFRPKPIQYNSAGQHFPRSHGFQTEAFDGGGPFALAAWQTRGAHPATATATVPRPPPTGDAP